LSSSRSCCETVAYLLLCADSAASSAAIMSLVLSCSGRAVCRTVRHSLTLTAGGLAQAGTVAACDCVRIRPLAHHDMQKRMPLLVEPPSQDCAAPAAVL
jgi:hypothetical protein